MLKLVRQSFTVALALCTALFIVITGSSAQSSLPPLIDREILFGNPEIAGAQISPDGQYIAFRKPYQDTMNIWVKRAGEPFDQARLVTRETKRPIRMFSWSRDGKYILFVNDFEGDENFNVYAVDPAAPSTPGTGTVTARNLTDLKKVRATIVERPRNAPDTIYVGLNDRDPRWHDLYQISLSTGKRQLVKQNSDRLDGYQFDNAGKLRLATRNAENGDSEILRLDADGKATKVYSCNVFETCSPLRFHADNRRVYLITNKGNVDLTRLVLFDPETGKEELVEADPLNRVDLDNARFSDVTNQLLFTAYEDDRQRIYFKDKAFEADYRFLQKQLPNREIRFDSATQDEQLWIITAWSDTEPGETYLFDRNTRQLTKQYRIRERLPREYLAEMRPIRYKSSDGLEIPAYLTLPRGIPAKNLPTIIMPHGGPWTRDSWGYDPHAQFAANRGYAVLQPNFRASTGFGKKFLDAGNQQWGKKMQDDLTYGVKYLVSQGITDPKRVGIWGGSYGGYAALAGITFTPDLYAAAIAEVAPSSLITLLETLPPYWEAGRTALYKRVGNPTTPEGRAKLIQQSPLTHVAKIRTPLLITQGANDPRVNQRESDQIVMALRDRNYPVEYLLAPDEGHGYARPVNNMAVLAAAERFLARHLGGRYQESMPPEVAERLKILTVDINTVTLPPRPTQTLQPQ